MTKQQVEINYTLKFAWRVFYFLTIAMVSILFFTRSHEFWLTTPIISSLSIGQHISNFALSYLIISITGVLNLIVHGTKSLKFVFAIGLTFIIANCIYELLLPVLNTRDVVDMYYGIGGTTIATIMLVLTANFGLKKNDRR